MQDLTRKEAKAALSEGKRLTHVYFPPDEWVEEMPSSKAVGEKKHYIFEDGISCRADLFWDIRSGEAFDKGWSIIEKEAAGE